MMVEKRSPAEIEELTSEDRFLLEHGVAGSAQGEKVLRIIDQLKGELEHASRVAASVGCMRRELQRMRLRLIENGVKP